MRNLLIFVFLAIADLAAGAEPMPLPRKMVPGEGALAIDAGFRIATKSHTDARLEAALGRLRTRIAWQTGITVSPTAAGKATLVVTCHSAGADYPTLGEDESYRLEAAPGGATIEAETVLGAMRGLETFAQLIAPGRRGFEVATVHIEDRPRFPWRGLMLDVSRHWMPAAVIERNLEAMAMVKMNVLHWHLSDDQGFRVESKRFPRLQQFGSEGSFYTQEQIRHVVAHARDLGIRVIPEFDMPGHTTSWFAGYPELASAPGPYSIERAWGIFEPVMNPAREETYTFLDGFLGEMAALFPDPYFHIGGDEVEDAQWKHSATIQIFATRHRLKSSHELQAYFNHRVQALLKKHGKTMIGWDEVLDAGLAKDTVIQSWRGPASLAEAARKGYRGVLSSGYYLDHLKPAGFHYAVDPLDGTELDAAQSARILGGEACMWAEYVSEETVDSRIWPRAAAIAERLWSSRDVRDVPAMYARLETVSGWLDATGAQHQANYAPMLDRLTGGRPADSVRVLADAAEALGIEVRRDARKYTSQVLLNRFVDAARPESESIRRLELAASRVASGHPAQPDLAELRTKLTTWAENDSRFEPLAQENFLTGELIPLSRNLSELGAEGLRALQYLESGHGAPADWLAHQLKILDQMQKGAPVAEVNLAAARPVRLLLEGLARKTTSAENSR